jgi:NAD(P)-dependent dehydrogenase (short-subunit alcohol dehydrogenase family)
MSQPGSLSDRVALVTGASRGVGRGVAAALAEAGAKVFATGRSIEQPACPPGVTAIRCDHTDDAAVEGAFGWIDQQTGRLDILVNSAWGGYERMLEDGRFTWSMPFWEQPLWRWESMITAGVRSAYVASQLAARRMVPHGRGLIVHISSFAAKQYGGNTVCGIAKAATDKLAADMGHELQTHGVTVVSMYPGLVRTENVLAAKVFDLSNSESPEFIGRAVAALATDPGVARWNGQVVVAAALGREYGFTDIDGKQPAPLEWASS